MTVKSILELKNTSILLDFDCGDDNLNIFLQRYAKQNDKNNIGKTFLCFENNQLIGFVTLSTAQIEFGEIPTNYLKIPKYPIPAIRIARLAIDKRYQGQGFGATLLKFSLYRAILVSLKVGVKLVVVEAKEQSKSFYERYGFVHLPNQKLTYVLPIESVIKAAIK